MREKMGEKFTVGILMVECHKCGKIHMKLVNVAGIHMGLSENLVEHHQNTSNISNVDR